MSDVESSNTHRPVQGVWHASNCTRRAYPGNNVVYGGGHATYCVWTRPMAVYAPTQEKTFFVFGDAENSPAISSYDHRTGALAAVVVLGRNDSMDAHKNPHLLIDKGGFLYVFFGCHNTPVYLTRSLRPYDISTWTTPALVTGKVSYPQPWQLREDEVTFFYRRGTTHSAVESLIRSHDGGQTWDEPVDIVTPPPENGVYAVSIANPGPFPRRLQMAWSLTRGDWWERYHLFYAYSDDGGDTWRRSDGTAYQMPVTEPSSEMLYESEVPDRGVWLQDMQVDAQGNPYILFIDGNTLTYECHWKLAERTTGEWRIHEVATSDHMYDVGVVLPLAPDDLRVWGPTSASQPHEDGGEIEEWRSRDGGVTWLNTKHITSGSQYSHNHVKAVFGPARRDFRVFWTYGDSKFPPATRDVALYYYGEELDKPVKMDLNYAD